MRHVLATMLSVCALLIAVPATAQANETPDPTTEPGAQHVGSEVVDLGSITWLDEKDGSRISQEQFDEFNRERIRTSILESQTITLPPIAQPFTIPAGCSSTNYKVLYDRDWDTTVVASCYQGTGTWTVNQQNEALMLRTVIGVCPGSNRGQIQYVANNNVHWSTLRGPYASNSTCFLFSSSGVYPTGYRAVYLNAP